MVGFFLFFFLLLQLLSHYHASVVSFAQQLLDSGVISYPGDPLRDFTIIRFLDRFVYKNPKLKQSDHGGSVMQVGQHRIDRAQRKRDLKCVGSFKEEDGRGTRRNPSFVP